MVVELLGVARSVTGAEPKCINCKHYKLYPPDPVLLYSSPKHRCTAAIDLVTGKMTETDCYAMRHRWVECGPEAKLFKLNEDAPVPPPSVPPILPVKKERIGLISLLAALAALALLVALAFWRYEQETAQPIVVKTGEVSVRRVSVKDGSCCVTARTRLVAIGKRSLWQFEASPNVWEDCGDDCEKALRTKLPR
jgi:hypothetical protein